MKIAITGNTSGIGLALQNIFAANGHEVFGFSRSSGYDIENKADRERILNTASNCDIFINNAYSPTGQTLLLNELISQWQNSDKSIINLSSKLSFFPKGKIHQLDHYISEKNKQNDIIQNRITQAKPKLMNVIIGLVDTPMSKVFTSDKLKPESLAQLIYNMSVAEDFYIQQLIVEVPGLDWKNIKGF